MGAAAVALVHMQVITVLCVVMVTGGHVRTVVLAMLPAHQIPGHAHSENTSGGGKRFVLHTINCQEHRVLNEMSKTNKSTSAACWNLPHDMDP